MSNNGDLFGKLRKKDNAFAKYGLTGNPFPAQAIVAPHSYDFNEKIRVRELEEIRDKFLAPSINGEAMNTWVIGPTGVGKSSMLRYIQDIINERYGDDCIALYVYSPLAGVASIYSDFVNDLIKVGLSDVVTSLLRKAIKQNPDLIRKEKEEKTTRQTFKVLKEAVVASAFDLDGAIDEVKKLLFKKFPYVEPRIVELVMEFIRNPDSVSDLRNVKKAENLNALIGLIHLIHLSGYKMIYLFIDQLEMGWGRWTSTQKERFNIDMRELVVRTKPLMSIEVTCNEDIISDFENNFPQLLRPLPKTPDRTIYIGFFNLPSVKKLIQWYLDRKRTDSNFAELAPFDEDAVKEIYERTARNTERILLMCHGLLNYASQHQIDLITRDMVVDHSTEVASP
jgi:hypothetical protein